MLGTRRVLLFVSAATIIGATLAWAANTGVETGSGIGNTEANACESALSIATAKVPYGASITEKKCQCREKPEEKVVPWSCLAMVSWKKDD